MSRTVTIATIKQRVRDAGDIDENYVSDAMLLRWINSAYADLYCLLADAADYFLSSTDINVVSGTATYPLPSDFYLLRGVDLLDSGSSVYRPIDRFMFAERHIGQQNATDAAYCYRYMLLGPSLRLAPTPTYSLSSGLRLWYIPSATVFDSDTQVLDGISGWEEYIVQDCLVKNAGREESDPSQFIADRQRLEQRVREMAAKRDYANPMRWRDRDVEDAWKTDIAEVA